MDRRTGGAVVAGGTIQPSTRPTVSETLTAAARALKGGRLDGIVVDLPSASFLIEVQIPEGVIVGRLPTVGSQGSFAMAFEEGSPIVTCVDLALQEMKDDGTLDEIRREWLAGTTDAPLIRA